MRKRRVKERRSEHQSAVLVRLLRLVRQVCTMEPAGAEAKMRAAEKPLVSGKSPAQAPSPKLLLLTAEELLMELVEEHRDMSFDFKSPMGCMRSGRLVGGDAPIQDSRTLVKFKTLQLWCQQVSVPPPLPRGSCVVLSPSFLPLSS